MRNALRVLGVVMVLALSTGCGGGAGSSSGDASAGDDGSAGDASVGDDGGTGTSDAGAPDAGSGEGAACTGLVSAGWCWHNPWPQGNALRSIAGDDEMLYVARDRWRPLLFDGAEWSTGDTPPGHARMYATWAGPSGEVWFMGAGSAMRFDGAEGEAFDVPPQAVQGVWGAASDDVWAVGQAILHFDGESWSYAESMPGNGDVWGSGPEDVWVASSSGVVRFDGESWSRAHYTSAELFAVHGTGPEDVWAVGESGLAVHYGGGGEEGFTEYELDTWMDLYGVWSPAPGEAWAVGGRSPRLGDDIGPGIIARFSEGAWEIVDDELATTLHDIWGRAEDDVWAVGEAGAVYHYDGASWTREGRSITEPPLAQLNDLAGTSSTDIWVGGGDGIDGKPVLAHWNGTEWTAHPTFEWEYARVSAVWPASDGHVWVADRNAEVRRYAPDGSYTSGGLGGGIYDLWGSSDAAVYAVGENGTIGRYDGDAWSSMETGIDETLRAIHGTDPRDVWAVGQEGTILRYDAEGDAWAVDETVEDSLNGVWSHGAGDVWAFGDDLVWHREDGDWVQNPPCLECGRWRAGWGTAPDDVWVGDSNGRVSHWDGSEWEDRIGVTDGAIHGMWGTGSRIWLAGDSGALLERER